MYAPPSPIRFRSSAEMLSTVASPARSSLSDLDTSLDDEFAATRGHETEEMKYADPSEQHQSHQQASNNHQTQQWNSFLDEDEQIEQARPTIPTPYQHTPAPSHAERPSMHAMTPQPFTMAELDASFRHPVQATPSQARPMNLSLNAPLTDYRGTPIDPTMRRNLLTPASATHTASVSTNAFCDAAAASLTLTASQALLQSFASPRKNHSFYALEQRMHDLHMDTDIHETNLQAIVDSNMESNGGDLLEIVTASVEEAEDAVEEMGKQEDQTPDEKEVIEDQNFVQDVPSTKTQQSAFLHSDEYDPSHYASNEASVHHGSFTPSHTSREHWSTPTSSAAPTPMRFETLSAAKIRAGPNPIPMQEQVEPLAAAATCNQTHKLVAHATRVPTSLSAKKGGSSSKKKKLASLPRSAPKAVSLPKIAPPTLDAWQRETGSGKIGQALAQEKASVLAKQDIQAKLKLVKRKLLATNGSGAKDSSAMVTAQVSAPSTRPSSKGVSTSKLLQSLQHRLNEMDGATDLKHQVHRAPLVTLSSNLPRPQSTSNPWMSDSELRIVEEQRYASPKRVPAAVQHTPAKTESIEDESKPVLVTTYQPFALRTAQSSLWTKQIASDRIHDNLRYFTSAWNCVNDVDEMEY